MAYNYQKDSTQSLNTHAAIYMYIHVRVYLQHAHIHVSLCKAFNRHQNVASSKSSKGIDVQGHLKILWHQNHFLFLSF